jgi:hypothetical protein
VLRRAAAAADGRDGARPAGLAHQPAAVCAVRGAGRRARRRRARAAAALPRGPARDWAAAPGRRRQEDAGARPG